MTIILVLYFCEYMTFEAIMRRYEVLYKGLKDFEVFHSISQQKFDPRVFDTF